MHQPEVYFGVDGGNVTAKPLFNDLRCFGATAVGTCDNRQGSYRAFVFCGTYTLGMKEIYLINAFK